MISTAAVARPDPSPHCSNVLVDPYFENHNSTFESVGIATITNASFAVASPSPPVPSAASPSPLGHCHAARSLAAACQPCPLAALDLVALDSIGPWGPLASAEGDSSRRQRWVEEVEAGHRMLALGPLRVLVA